MERQRVMFPWDLISLAAVFLDVTQRSPKRALRDDGNDNKNGKKEIGLDWQNDNFACTSHLFLSFVAQLRHEYS